MSVRVGFDAWGLSGALLQTGMGQYARHIIDGIAHTDGFDVFAYGAPGEPRPAWLPASAGWRAPRTPGPRKTAALLTRAFTLRRLVEADAIDVFHAPALHVRPSMPPVPSVSCPVVSTIHDAIPLTAYGAGLPWRLRAFYRWNLRRALATAAIITVSDASRREISAQTGIASSHVTVIPNGVDFPPNADRRWLDRVGVPPKYLLYAGSYEPRKNLRGALAAYAQVLREGGAPELVAVVEAASGHAATAERAITALGIGGHVRLLHSLDVDALRALYTHADTLLFPSLAEGFGFPPLQAAQCGTPVVASDLAAIRETMGGAARYVDPRDARSVAEGLRDVLRDASLRTRLIEAGRARAAQFPWDAAVSAHAGVYAAIAKRPAAAIAAAVAERIA